MLKSSRPVHAWKWAKRGPRIKYHLKRLMLNQAPPKPLALRDPRVWTKDKKEMKSFSAPEWDLWSYRSNPYDLDEALQPLMDMPQSLKKRMYDVPWWANPFGSWYLNNILRVELIKLGPNRDGVRSYREKIDVYRKHSVLALSAGTTPSEEEDDDKILKRILAERWRTLEFGDRDRGYPCTYADYILFLNEWFRSLDEEGRQRLREHFDKNIRPLLSVMSPSDVQYLEAKTQNTMSPEEERRAAMYSNLGTPEFLDMSQRLKYEINEDYKVRDELGPEMFALWSKAPERWPPERLAKMYSLDFTLVRKILVWHHFKACYDSCVEPDWSLPKRLFALEWLRDVRARQQGRFYGRMRFAESKISFFSDKKLFRDYLNRREATYQHTWEMDDPYRFLQTERDLEDYYGDNYDMYRRLFPEMIGRAGEPIVPVSKQPIWAGPHSECFRRSPYNWMFAEIGINVGHDALKKVELDPTNPKHRRFIVAQPDGSLRTAKLSEQRAWYWKEQWADFRFWLPRMEWGQDSPSTESYQELHRSTADADIRRGQRMSTGATKWFYQSHYTRVGSYDAGADRHKDTSTRRPVLYPMVVNSGQVQMKNKPLLKTYRLIPDV